MNAGRLKVLYCAPMIRPAGIGTQSQIEGMRVLLSIA